VEEEGRNRKEEGGERERNESVRKKGRKRMIAKRKRRG